MSSNPNNNSNLSWYRILTNSVQLRFFNKENLEPLGEVEYSPKILYMIIGVFSMIIMGIVFSLLAFTPLQNLIPNYDNLERKSKYIELVNNIENLEIRVEYQSLYIDAFRQIVTKNQLDQARSIYNKNMDSKKETGMYFQSQSKKDIHPIEDQSTIFDETEDIYFVSPLSGQLSSHFDPQSNHLGVDIIAPKNSPVKAIMDGHIIISDWNVETGHTIGIQHNHNILSFYKHNSILLKEKGNKVKAGEAIAIIGNSGKLTSGPHLHFELWHEGKAINPTDFINIF